MKRVRGANHGLSLTPEYPAWQQMRLRCLDPKHAAYSSYGGRGISVCLRWRQSAVNFIADMGPKPSKAHELDRIDNDKGYDCGACEDCGARAAQANCRWATRTVNDRNRRSNRILEIGGVKRTLVEWSELHGIIPETISLRLKLGWSTEDAVTVPVGSRRAPRRRREVVPENESDSR